LHLLQQGWPMLEFEALKALFSFLDDPCCQNIIGMI
jgi:hypothetical protein